MARQSKNKGFRLAPNITDQKISFKFTIDELNNFIGYLMKEKSAQITNKSLSFMRELFDTLDDTPFESDKKLYERVYFIRRALKARLDRGMENESIIFSLSINVPDEDLAKHICKKWDSNPEEIFSSIIKTLTTDLS